MKALKLEDILVTCYTTAACQLIKIHAEQAETDPEVLQLHKDVCEALKVGEETDIAYTDLYDSLTARQFHNKGWPAGMTEELYVRIEKEAFR